MSSIPVQFVDYDEFLAIEIALASASSAAATASTAARHLVGEDDRTTTLDFPLPKRRNCTILSRFGSENADLGIEIAEFRSDNACSGVEKAQFGIGNAGTRSKNIEFGRVENAESTCRINEFGSDRSPIGVENAKLGIENSRSKIIEFGSDSSPIGVENARLRSESREFGSGSALSGIKIEQSGSENPQLRRETSELVVPLRPSTRNSRRLPSWGSKNASLGDNQIQLIGTFDELKRLHELGIVQSYEFAQECTLGGPLAELQEDEVSEANGSDGGVPELLQTHGAPWGIVRSGRRVFTKCKLQTLQFKGHIIYSSTMPDAEEAALKLLRLVEARKAADGGSVPLGFDTEWKVIYKRGAPRRKVAVLQLCVDADRCDVFHLVHSGMPPPLRSLLEDPSILKVGVGAYGDAAKLRMDYNVSVKGVKDLSNLANERLLGSNGRTQLSKNWSLSSLTQELIGKQVDKAGSIRTGDWEIGELSQPQLQYAATDAFASLYIYQVLMTFPEPNEEDRSSALNCLSD